MVGGLMVEAHAGDSDQTVAVLKTRSGPISNREVEDGTRRVNVG